MRLVASRDGRTTGVGGCENLGFFTLSQGGTGTHGLIVCSELDFTEMDFLSWLGVVTDTEFAQNFISKKKIFFVSMQRLLFGKPKIFFG